MKIGIVGSGPMGRNAAQLWVANGHEVMLSSRRPEVLGESLREAGLSMVAGGHAEAAEFGDCVFLAVAHPALIDVAGQIASPAAGKIVVDSSNPMGLDERGSIISTLPESVTQGQNLARLLPKSVVARGFTHVMAELLLSRGSQQKNFWAMAYAADVDEARTLSRQLISDAGFIPVLVGSLAESAALDPGGALFPNMFTPADMARVVAASGSRPLIAVATESP